MKAFYLLYVFFVIYPWVIYPMLLVVYRRLHGKPTPYAVDKSLASWVIVTAGRNCDDRVKAHLEHMDELAENHGCASAVYIDDGSDSDNMDLCLDVVDGLRYDHVDLLKTGRHVGKEAALSCVLNDLRDQRRPCYNILFLDIGVTVEPDTLTALDRDDNYQSMDVAGIAFNDDVPDPSGYITAELKIRRLEDEAGGLVGSGGMAMAMKYQYLPPVLTAPADLTLVRWAKVYNRRFISGGTFTAHYKPATSGGHRRRVRTAMRGMAGVKLVDDTWWNIKLVSHKHLRWFSSVLIALNPIAWVLYPWMKPHFAILEAAVRTTAGQKITKWDGTKR